MFYTIRSARIIRLILLLSCVFWFLPAKGQSAPLRVGIYSHKPNVDINPNGSAGGILGEILTEIARLEDWSIKVYPCNWAICMKQIQNGDIDILPDVFYSEERANSIDFHTVPVLHSWSQVYAPKGNGFNILQDLEGLRIAVLAGSAQYEYLSVLLPSLNIKSEINVVDKLDHGFDLVKRGVVDAVVSDYLFAEMTAPDYGLISTPIIFLPVKIHYGVPKGKHAHILNTIDNYLSVWQKDPDSVYYQILSNWYSPLKQKNADAIYKAWQIYLLLALVFFTGLVAWWFKRNESHHRRILSISENRHNAVLGLVDALIYIKDSNHQYIYANRKVADFFNVSMNSILNQTDSNFISNKGTLETINKSDTRVLLQDSKVTVQESLVNAVTGKEHIFLSSKVPLRNSAGEVEGLCAIMTDITDRVEAQEEVRRLAFYDMLTDLPNRRMLMIRLEKSFNNAKSYKAIGALLSINLDGFKKINETRGYRVGDSILRVIAQRLLANTRERDTVARISGDEFIVILNRLGDTSDQCVMRASKIAEKISSAIFNEPIVVNNESSVISVCIGVTMLNSQSASIDEVMREAGLALQRAKASNTNSVVFYEEAAQLEVEERMWLEQDLAAALNTPQLQMYIQPQYSHSGNVTGAELLARWMHPERGFISPGVFIPIAEESGIITHLTDWALEVACQTLKRLALINHNYPISINMSPKRLMEPNFVHYVRNLLGKTGAPGEKIVFEITESVWVQDIELLVARMNELNSLGIRFAVDDFGTGYSNLAYLNRLPLYELKIDQSLIKDIPHNTNSTEIVKLVLAVAEQLKLRVVAEGVELSEQADFLWGAQCDALQGYLMARPMPIAEWINQAAGVLPSGQ